MKKLIELGSSALLCLGSVVLIGLQLKIWGWVILGFGLLTLLFSPKQFKKDIFLIYLGVFILGFTSINTNISYSHMLEMGFSIGLALFLPYFISRFIYKDNLIRFRFHHARQWYKSEFLYIFITAVVAYFLLPFFLKNTGSYLNWSVAGGWIYLLRLFIGTNGLGIWDELFFISTVLGILRRHFTFGVANFIQAILFTSFLYELGFRGWGFVMIFIFALIQGYIFKKTESLFYVITIHLTLDLILYLALIHAYYPNWVPIFLN